MFKLRTPCVNCPFTKSRAPLFALPPERIRDIVQGPAFQCHKTVVYGYDDEADEETHEQGLHPQQCAGLMAMLHAAGIPNQIMQVAERLAGFDASKISTKDTFRSVEETIAAHNPGHGAPVANHERTEDV